MEDRLVLAPQALTAARRAATVAHALPGVRLRLRVAGVIMGEVGGATAGAGVPTIGPCTFRRAVGLARTDERSGQELVIEVGVPAGGLVHVDGIYRVAVGDLDVHAFASTLPIKVCRAVPAADDSPVSRHPSAPDVVRLHRDVVTDVTLVHVVTSRSMPVERHPVLNHLVPILVAEEIVREVATTVQRPA